MLAVVVSVVTLTILLLMGRRDKAAKVLWFTIAVVSVYSFVLVGFGLASRPKVLALGEPKCFDDWCFVVRKVGQVGQKLTVECATLNQGRRGQKPDSPKLFVVFDGVAVPHTWPALGDRVEGHSENAGTIKIDVPGGTTAVDLLVTEGGGPSGLIIDDENSPFHRKAIWHLLP